MENEIGNLTLADIYLFLFTVGISVLKLSLPDI